MVKLSIRHPYIRIRAVLMKLFLPHLASLISRYQKIITMAAASTTTTSFNNKIKIDPKAERLRKQKREKLLRRLIPILLVLPYFLGIIWTALHPIVSIITGELKCRGSYIDENGLDVLRHQVKSYPLKRVMSSSSTDTATVEIGLCDAVFSGRLPISYAATECIRHEATEDVVLDIARIMPALGPMIDSAEAIVIVVGEQNERTDACHDQNINKGWYDASDLNASMLHMIQRLGSSGDAPWLTKIVYIVSPSKINTNNATIDNSPSCHPQTNLTTVVDTFITAYLGTSDASSIHYVNPLPPRYSSPMIRSLLVLRDVVEEQHQNTQQGNTQVRILPQGTGGALPNLDLVFATYYAFQTHPSDGMNDQSDSIYYAGSEFRTHPFGTELENRVKGVFSHLGNILDLDKSSLVSLESYASDLAGWFGFVAASVIGPVQPHSFALKRGIDALTIEVNVPVSKASVAAPIHPHYADLSRCMEQLLRSISNLHERLHHSVVQYTMPSPSKFVSHGEYIYPAILVSLPLVVRAASLALRDISLFQFKFVGHVVGTVVLASCLNALTVLITRRSFIGVLIIIVVRVMRLSIQQSCNQRQEKDDVKTECCKSLRFVTCLVSIYLHVPLLLANYSLGFPSAVFWTPLLAILVLPTQQSLWLSKNVVTNTIMTIAKILILIAISPSTILPSNTPPQYTLMLYTPLQLLLTALWFI